MTIDYLTMLRANGHRTWAETSYRPMEYRATPPPRDPEELTPEQQEHRLAAIRARPFSQVGMSVVELMKFCKDSKKFSHSDLAAIADRCFSDTPLSKDMIHLLAGQVIPRNRWSEVAARLRL